jgi:hypothetical protein
MILFARYGTRQRWTVVRICFCLRRAALGHDVRIRIAIGSRQHFGFGAHFVERLDPGANVISRRAALRPEPCTVPLCRGPVRLVCRQPRVRITGLGRGVLARMIEVLLNRRPFVHRLFGSQLLTLFKELEQLDPLNRRQPRQRGR